MHVLLPEIRETRVRNGCGSVIEGAEGPMSLLQREETGHS
jgi:hypothetical protein